jgi:hypothetical protein
VRLTWVANVRFDCDVSLDDFSHVEAHGGDRIFFELPCSKDMKERCLPTILETDQSDLVNVSLWLLFVIFIRDLHFGAPEERAEPVQKGVPPRPHRHRRSFLVTTRLSCHY